MKRNSEHIANDWLVINAQSGSDDAFEALIRFWYPKLLRYAQNRLGNRDAANDVVQNTLIKVSKKLGALRDIEAFPAWVYQILQSKMMDYLRSEQRREKGTAALKEQLDEPYYMDDVNEEIDFNQALHQLPQEAYLTVHLFYLEGFSLAEIATILRIPAGTVKSRLSNARKQLSKYINGENDE